jgi:hypothetical protein
VDPAIVVALVAAGVSVLSIVVTAWAQVWTAIRLDRSAASAAEVKKQTELELAELSTKLAVGKDQASARTAYNFEARKRLYADVNPLLFRLREQCAGSVRRVRRIVREDIVVDTPRHVLTSTQRIVGPLVLSQELQRHLTAVDLRLDEAIRAQYVVSRELLWILHEGTSIAAAEPPLTYRRDRRMEQEPRQHLTFAQLQRIVDAMTTKDEDGTRRPLTIVELEDRQQEPAIAAVLARMQRLFANSSPQATPVLWRLLLAQACLMEVLTDLVDRSAETIGRVLPVDIDDYRWSGADGATFASQIDAVDNYLRAKLNRAGFTGLDSSS